MPVEGRRSIGICRRCQSALAVRILADGSIRPIGTGTQCSCGGESFALVGDYERTPEDSETATDGDDETATDGDDERKYQTP